MDTVESQTERQQASRQLHCKVSGSSANHRKPRAKTSPIKSGYHPPSFTTPACRFRLECGGTFTNNYFRLQAAVNRQTAKHQVPWIKYIELHRVALLFDA